MGEYGGGRPTGKRPLLPPSVGALAAANADADAAADGGAGAGALMRRWSTSARSRAMAHVRAILSTLADAATLGAR